MLTLGQGEPSGMVAGNWADSSVQGQPVLPAGGEGSSVNVGQRIESLLMRLWKSLCLRLDDIAFLSRCPAKWPGEQL